MEKRTGRNDFVDIIRGIAMLLVVLGHTMTGSTANSENTFLYNVIWTLQMPLFILISGYVNRYSRPIDSGKALLDFLRKRTLSYLLPWAVWTFFVRGFIFQEKGYFDISHLLWHMDNGYWFLVTIWTITVIFGCVSFIVGKILPNGRKGKLLEYVCFTLLYILGMGVLLGIGIAVGLSFFAIKLTLYYMPFYYFGFMFGRYQDLMLKQKRWPLFEDCAIAAASVLWVLIMVRVNVFRLDDNGPGVLIRAMASMTGCVSVIGLLSKMYDGAEGSVQKERKLSVPCFLKYVGTHSIEIYLSHYLLINLLLMDPKPLFMTVGGIGLTFVNYVIVIVLVMLVILAFRGNKVLQFALFGKK